MDYITLLDCSHQQSSGYVAGNTENNSLFTCKMGEGIRVEQGDKVSVHQTYISETGSDANSIQIEGKYIGKRSITHTILTNFEPSLDTNNYLYGYERITASNVTEEIDLYQNKTSILINFYKSGNGENHFNLPRRYVNKLKAGILSEWGEADVFNNGRINASQIFSTTQNASYNGNDLSAFLVDEDYFYFQAGNPTNKVLQNCWKVRNNNPRYKIMVREDTRYGAYTGASPSLMNGSIYSPAELPYIEYIQKIDLDLNDGFRSPDYIANTITDALRKQSQPEINKVRSSAIFDVNASLVTERPVNVELNSPSYKTFFSASPFTNNETNYNSWTGNDVDTAESNKYLSSFQYIGIKRPELWLAGREWAKTYISVNPLILTIAGACFKLRHTLLEAEFRRDQDLTGTRSHQVVTSLLWANSEDIMSSFRTIFEEQANHPELFENKFTQLRGFTNINNSRFIHQNVITEPLRRAQDSNFSFTLGCDFLNPNGSGVGQLTSVPFFFDYNPTYKNLNSNIGGKSWEQGYAYGAFLKYIEPGTLTEYVSFTTRYLGIEGNVNIPASFTSIPNCLFTENHIHNGSINTETYFGWDIHFNSYGNAVIGLTDGWKEEMFDSAQRLNMLPTGYNTTEINTSLYSQKIYLGADEPLLEYNTTANRFEISKLHTSERVQNRYNAGGVATDEKHDTAIVNEFATQGDKVYKVNKRLFNNNFTPASMPYTANRIENLAVGTANYQVDFLNPNLEGWTIYDQLCGIIIKDFGYDEANWTQSFWNTIGFDYSQFNSVRTSENDLTARIGNNNKNNLPYAITNANVGTTDTMDFVTNIFGAGSYTLQLPSTMSFNAHNVAPNNNADFRIARLYEQFPAVTEIQKSVILQAPRLPRKLANPYFCIRSDILDESQYIGGYESGQMYPVIATIPKSNDFGDFFVSLDSSLEFTFTAPKTITHITTFIANPDQTSALVDASSSIIYKLTRKLNPNRFNIIQQVLEENKTK